MEDTRENASDDDELLASIWLYVDWHYVTRNLTTEQRERWVDALRRTGSVDSDPDDRLTAWRWWAQ